MGAERTIAIVGGGVAGLAAGYRISKTIRERALPVRLACFEEQKRCGGHIATVVEDGFVCESGPNGFLDKPAVTRELSGEIGLEPRLLPSSDRAAARYVFLDGALRQVPTGAGAFLRSGVLNWSGKLRLLGEPFISRRKETTDESIFDFAARRIGAQAASRLVDAMVTGIYAGDPHKLSLAACFPKMKRMEDEHGGLVKAMLAKRRAKNSGGPAGPAGKLTSFDGGMQTLTDRLAEAIGPALRLGVGIERITRTPGGYSLQANDGSTTDAEVVVVACPSYAAAKIVDPLDRELARRLSEIPTAPIVVVHLGFDEGLGLEGFGFLAPPNHGVRMLGNLWSSNIFAGRAPNGGTLLTAMIGGARDSAAVELDDEQLIRTVRKDVATSTGVTAEPRLVRIVRWRRGIPQYELGHLDRLEAIDRRLDEHPGLLLYGSSYRGVSVNDCIAGSGSLASCALALAAAAA